MYQYPVVDTGLLTGIGATTELAAGVSFWNRYGRTLYNATAGQLAYNASFPNGTARVPIVLRTTGQSRIENSEINWALGFFGSSFLTVPNPSFTNITRPYEVVVIPEGGAENNTLASYDSCFNDNDATIGYLGDLDLFTYLPKYLTAATSRLQRYAPAGFTLNVNDTYAMQSICAYEYGYIGMSDFCGLFTADEWAGFENTLDIECLWTLGPPFSSC
jgi:Histidine phosphatase superfamily (branch 2)